MQCERCWQKVDRGNRCNGCQRTIGEDCCGGVTWRWKDKDRICADCIGTDDENRRAKLTARSTRVVGVDKKMTVDKINDVVQLLGSRRAIRLLTVATRCRSK